MLPILSQLVILRPFLVTGKLGGVAEWISVLADMRHHVVCMRYVTAQGMSGSFELLRGLRNLISSSAHSGVVRGHMG